MTILDQYNALTQSEQERFRAEISAAANEHRTPGDRAAEIAYYESLNVTLGLND